jgi:rRNA maturation protein Rpf1
MESGRVDVEQQKKQYHFTIKGAKSERTFKNFQTSSEQIQEIIFAQVYGGTIRTSIS